MGVGGVLERGADGILRYTQAGGPATCVVPENMKFEHNATFTAAAMADSADLRALAAGPGGEASAAAPPMKKGVKLVFVAAPDVELAEYLLAQRIGNVAGWQSYLAKYPSAPHTQAAKQVLAVLYVDAGERSMERTRRARPLPT